MSSLKEPCIILAASGMVIPGTMSYRLAQNFLFESKSAIFTIGYMDENSPGYQIANAKKGDVIRLQKDSEEIKVSCTLKKFRFSAHSKTGKSFFRLCMHCVQRMLFWFMVKPESIDWLGAHILRWDKTIKVYTAVKGKTITIE